MYDLISWWEEPEKWRAFIEAHGLWGPFCFVLLQATQVVLAPIPGEVTGFLAGFLFGPWWGFFYAMIGLAIGSSIAFYLARLFRRTFARRFEKSLYFQRLSHFMAKRGILAAFVCFLIPGFPKDYLSYFLGLFPIPWSTFLIIMILGRIPGTLALTLQGAATYERNWTLLALVTAVSLIFFGLFYLFRDRIYRYLEGKSAHPLS